MTFQVTAIKDLYSRVVLQLPLHRHHQLFQLLQCAVVELRSRRIPSSPTSFSSLYSWKKTGLFPLLLSGRCFVPLGSFIEEMDVRNILYIFRVTSADVSPSSSRDADIRQNQTDGSNYCCQSHHGPLRRRQRAGRLKCQGDALLITSLSAWLCPDIKPNVLPVTLGQAVSLQIYHRTLRPGIIRARGRGSPASLCDKLLSDRPQNAKN